MRYLWSLGVVLVLGTSGCMTVVGRPITRPLPAERKLIRPTPNQPALAAKLEYTEGLLRGHLSYTNACRVALLERNGHYVLHKETPNYGLGFLAVVSGVAATAISYSVLSRLDSFSDVERCGPDSDGRERCSSPRSAAAAYGTMGFLGGVALTTTGIVTFASRQKTKTIELGPAAEPGQVKEILEPQAACGDGAAANFGLVLSRGETAVAKTTSNELGDFAFAVPEGLTGQVSLAVDQLPFGPSRVTQGERITAFDIPAVAPTEAPPAEVPPTQPDEPTPDSSRTSN